MFEISESRVIKITRQDTAVFTLKTNYTLTTGDKVYLTVKEDPADTEPKLQLIVDEFLADGSCVFKFTTKDTDIPAGDYLYDIQVDFADGRRYTIMYPTKFKVMDQITSNS